MEGKKHLYYLVAVEINGKGYLKYECQTKNCSCNPKKISIRADVVHLALLGNLVEYGEIMNELVVELKNNFRLMETSDEKKRCYWN